MQRFKLFIPLILLFILLPLFYVGLKLNPRAMPSALVGNPAPAFLLPTVEDMSRKMDESYFKGKVTLLNVWASWCFACKDEHPYLYKLSKQGINIVGVNYKDKLTAAKKWLRDLHDPYQFTLFDKKGRLGLDLGITGAPETFVIDKQGIVRYRRIGVINDEVWHNTLKPLYQKLSASN